MTSNIVPKAVARQQWHLQLQAHERSECCHERYLTALWFAAVAAAVAAAG